MANRFQDKIEEKLTEAIGEKKEETTEIPRMIQNLRDIGVYNLNRLNLEKENQEISVELGNELLKAIKGVTTSLDKINSNIVELFKIMEKKKKDDTQE